MAFKDHTIGQLKTGEDININLKELVNEKTIYDLLKADLWANGHFPQIWSVKSILISEAFLKNHLEGGVTFEEFSVMKDSEFDKTDFLRKANNAHRLYGIEELKPEEHATTFERSLSEAMSVINSLVPPADFNDVLKAKKIESLFYLFNSISTYLKSPEAIKFSTEYKESLRGLPRKNSDIETRLTTDEETKLERYWIDFSEKLVSGMLNTTKKRMQEIVMFLMIMRYSHLKNILKMHQKFYLFKTYQNTL